MRRGLGLGLSFILLLATLVLSWTYRYELAPGAQRLSLRELKPLIPKSPQVSWHGSDANPVMRITRVAGERYVPIVFPVSPGLLAEALHLRMRIRVDDLVDATGKSHHLDVYALWQPEQGGEVELDSLLLKTLDRETTELSLVAVPADGLATPALQIVHWGKPGFFEVVDLEVVAVRERPRWVMLSVLLAVSLSAWFYFAYRKIWKRSTLGSLVACVLATVCVTQFALPGPWKTQMPLLGIDFRLDAQSGVPPAQIREDSLPVAKQTTEPKTKDEPRKEISTESPPPLDPPRVSQPVAETKDARLAKPVKKEGPMLWVKGKLSRIWPLLHVLQFMLPTMLLAWLVGRPAAMWTSILLAIATEGAQVALCYGVDFNDALHLLLDGLGIWLGLVAAAVRGRRKMKFWILNPSSPRLRRTSFWILNEEERKMEGEILDLE